MRAEMRSLRGSDAATVVRTLNPIVRGWTAYYRTVVSSAVFGKMDEYMWTLTFKWARRGHRNKSKHWVVARYYGLFNPYRNSR